MSDVERLMTPRQREHIALVLSERERWAAGSYGLEPLPDWDAARLPIVLAHSKVKKTGRRPAFALLPGDAVVADSDEGALGRLVQYAFAKVSPQDAAALARLATWFGGLGLHEARFVDTLPPSKAREPNLPRASAQPVYEAKGADHIVRFYVVQHGQQKLFDCELVIGPRGVVLSHRLVAAPAAARPESP